MERPAFEGKVMLDLTGASIREVIIRQGFIKAVPECVEFTGDAATLFTNLITIVSRTKSARLAGGTPDDNMIKMVEFAHFAKGNTDYRAVWENFLDLPSIEIQNQWMEAINADQLRAPVEIRPDTPTDDDLEELGTKEAQDFLGQGAST